ncbi:TIGR04086 family membrane protein [bacterium]|nr:TIGR04086 family membrane protein [bacterium]MCG2676579.1 TIGR04086 family membrane protein [bacterium]MCG2678126.1 TIGR04086 family membrane protein [bacterium]
MAKRKGKKKGADMQKKTLIKISKFLLAIIGGGIITVGTAKLFFGHAAFNFHHILLKINLTPRTAMQISTLIIHYAPTALLGGLWAGWIMRRRGWLYGLTLGILLVILSYWPIVINTTWRPIDLYAVLTILPSCTLGGYLGERLTKRKHIKR